ncbi:MAG: NADH:ubiquinone reductase (Na(+)-transporting) subunit C [Bacteroidales bacterium]|nr:NADH:ubiquinone reductase (Na(+)-transporting) subunit C [Bacteroidales bacterium]MCF8387245.1 NADH:ubiquinone reductase (Na(+)-transporting) subunit C [Bacteroidales bacterium]MCF8396684.1 NADH:ubiquinone reductase (Na(+)-transporting) subunit C [Bacteroidales bacterium]
MYSNAYIFRYATIMVIVVAAVLSGAAMLLKPFQTKNIKVDKMQGILAAANVSSTPEDAIELYRENILVELAIDKNGDIVSEYQDGELLKGDVRPFELKMKEELYKQSQGNDYHMPLYIARQGGDTVYIVPLYGKGLWGPIWGNIALGSGFDKVVGVSFDHKSETPGLGAEINTQAFEDQFFGKTIFNKTKEFVSIQVVKGGIDMLPQDMKIHGVDAISGGTITSNGVSDMLNDVLKLYVPFVKKHIR